MEPELQFCFGPFRLARSRRLLLEHDRPVRIGGRALDLLGLLLERAGRVVTKDELIRHAWPTTVVEETSLRFHIASLRKLLGEGPSGGRYIANITGRGYCFVAEVRREPLQETPPLPADEGRPAADGPPNNLPARLTRMVGRAELLAELATRLAGGRLVSVVGPGGMGKSTLALELAEKLLPSYRDGAWFVDLSVLSDPALVASAVATALGLGADPQDAQAHLQAFLAGRQMLVLLDNCEHLLEASARVALALLSASDGVHVIATSREALGCESESVLRLPALAVPAEGTRLDATQALTYAAVQLFVERAIASVDSFELQDTDAEAAAEICRRLEGMPLAIELVAARVDSFGVRGLVAQLDDRSPWMSSERRGVPHRHRTLRALLDWSYRILGDAEQRVLRQLAIFSGPFDQRALVSVLGSPSPDASSLLEHVAALAARSLVVVDSGRPEIAYRLLDTTRLYALEALRASGEHDLMRRRHAAYLCDVLAQSTADWICLSRQALMQRYAHYVDEVRAALDWAFGPTGDLAAGLRLTIVAAGPLGHLVAHPEEMLHRVRDALARVHRLAPPDPLVEYRLCAAAVTLTVLTHGTVGPAREVYARAAQLADALKRDEFRAGMLDAAFIAAYASGDYAEALRQVDAVAADLAPGDEIAQLGVERIRALCLHGLGQHERAGALARRVLLHPSPVIRVGGIYPYDRRVSMRIVVARTLWIQGRPRSALAVAQEAVEFSLPEVVHAMSHALAWALCPIALWCGLHGVAAAAVARLHEHSTQHRRDNWRTWAHCYRQVLALRRASPAADEPGAGDEAGVASAPLWDMMATHGPEFLSDQALARAESGAAGWSAPEVLRAAGERVRLQGRPAAEAERWFRRAIDLAAAQQAPAWELRAAISLARLPERARDDGVLSRLERCLAAIPERLETADLLAATRLLETAGVRDRSA